MGWRDALKPVIRRPSSLSFPTASRNTDLTPVLSAELRRVYAQYLEQANDLRKWVYLRTSGTATRCCSTGCSPTTSPRCAFTTPRNRTGRGQHQLRVLRPCVFATFRLRW